MRRPCNLIMAGVLLLTPSATAAATIAAATAAHADDPANCDAPGFYMPCGESMPAPSDPIYNQGLGDNGSSLVGDPVDPSVFGYGLGDNGESLAGPNAYDPSWNDNYDAWNGWNPDTGQPTGG